jgi:hypothetical protein
MGGVDDSWKRVLLTFTNYDMHQYFGRGGSSSKKITTNDYRASRLQKVSCTGNGAKVDRSGHLILHRYVLHSINFIGSESLFL